MGDQRGNMGVAVLWGGWKRGGGVGVFVCVCGGGGCNARVRKDTYRSGTRKGGDASDEWLWRTDKR